LIRLAPVPRSGLRAVAVATLFAFGCATTRQPLPPPPPSPPVERVYFEDPEMELWVEGAGSVDPAESQRAQAESRVALHAALDGRGVRAADAEAVLVLRERAVARTSGRKANQALATAGMVVGVVAIVAVVVVALVASKGKGGVPSGPSPRERHATAPAPPPGDRAHHAVPAPPPGTIVARPVPVPAPPPPVVADLYVNVWPPPQPSPVHLPPPPFSVADRGFFDPDEVLLEVVLRDARSGAILWSAAVRAWADPRDRAEVARLVETALGGQPWARRTGARPEPPPTAPAGPPPAG